MPRPTTVSVPRGMDVAVAWTWRLALLLGGLVLLGLVLGRVALLTASFAAGLLLTALLQPLAARAHRAGAPRRLAGGGVFVVFLLLVGVGLATLGSIVAPQVDDLASTLSEGTDRVAQALRSFGLPVSDQQVQELRDQAVQAVSVSSALTAVSTLLDVVSGIGLALFVTLVLVLDGRSVWAWVLRVLPQDAQQPADEAGHCAWDCVTSYVRGITVVALVDASLIAAALLLLGVPSVAPLAALTFLGAFLPYVGAAVAGLAAVAVALADQGGTVALLTLAAVLLVQTLDGYVVEPLVLGKAVRVHPLAVVVAITLGGLLAGIGGAVVAVPLAAAVNSAAVHLVRRQGEEAATGSPEHRSLQDSLASARVGGGPDTVDLRPRGGAMAAHAGEKARKTGDFYCAHCDEKVHAEEGEEIPECPNGHKTFETRRNEPGNTS